MKIIGVGNNKYLMVVADTVDASGPINENERCRVYNTETGELAPDLPIGSWTARVFPWEIPTKDYTKEMETIEALIESEE